MNLMKELELLVRILLVIMLISYPVVAYWHIELYMEFKEGVIITNGYEDFNPVQDYHDRMYSVFMVCFISAYFILRGGFKL